MNRNKTVAAWLALLGGPLGLHRFYLRGRRDLLGWLLPIPSLLGAYGVWRARTLGQDDGMSWILMPMLGFTAAACALTAIVYGLTAAQKWNRSFNPARSEDDPSGATNWVTVLALGTALLLGTAVLMASIAFSAQRIFEYEMAGLPPTACSDALAGLLPAAHSEQRQA